jgi:hypothetical protein
LQASFVDLSSVAEAKEVGPERPLLRRADALAKRDKAATSEALLPPFHPANGDEKHYESKIGNYWKGLPHNVLGEVDPQAYAGLLSALATGAAADLEAIELGGALKLSNPQASYAYCLEGADSHTGLTLVPPEFASHDQGSEMAECYWMALARMSHFLSWFATREGFRQGEKEKPSKDGEE